MARFRNHSNIRGVLTVAAEYSIIAGTLTLLTLSPPVWLYPLLIVVIGTRQYALAEVMTHEACHHNLCASRGLNDLLGIFTTWLFFYTLSGYRRYHLEHHRIALSDEKNNIYEEYAFWGLPKNGQTLTKWRAVWLFIIKPFIGITAIQHVMLLVTDLYYDRDLKENYWMVLFWLIVLAFAWRLGLFPELLLFWIFPQLYVHATLNYWSEVGDHFNVRNGETRSDLNWFLNRLIAHNIGYHALHHLDPRIPWYMLPQAYEVNTGKLTEVVSGGYIETFRQISE